VAKCHDRNVHEEAVLVLNNRFAREALKQAATQVNQGVRDGAKHFVESEVSPLRDRIDELEGRVARLERQLNELIRERDRGGR
jgi:polyhydroxyalkanoate synthesis regulator phasin